MADISTADQLRAVEQNLALELAEIDNRRAPLVGALTNVREALAQLGYAPSAKAPAASNGTAPTGKTDLPTGKTDLPTGKADEPAADESMTVREAIMYTLRSDPRPWRTVELVRSVRGLGVDAQDDTTRSLISKMHRSGKIEQVERGLYRLLPASTIGSDLARIFETPKSGDQERSLRDALPTEEQPAAPSFLVVPERQAAE